MTCSLAITSSFASARATGSPKSAWQGDVSDRRLLAPNRHDVPNLFRRDVCLQIVFRHGMISPSLQLADSWQHDFNLFTLTSEHGSWDGGGICRLRSAWNYQCRGKSQSL